MNRTILAILGLVFSFQMAHATSPMLPDARLELTVSPARHIVGGTTQKVRLDYRGNAYFESCRAVFPRPCQTKLIDRLPAWQMDRIGRDIEVARQARTIRDNGPVCLAIPNQHLNYSADNHSVLLKAVARPCGNATYKEGRAAARLTALLDGLFAKAQRGGITLE